MCELAYHILQCQDLNIVLEDAKLRYGEQAEKLVQEAQELIRKVQEKCTEESLTKCLIDECGDKLRELISKRVTVATTPLIQYFSKCETSTISENQIKTLIELLGLNISTQDLVRMGVLMHVEEGRVMIPEYIPELGGCPQPPIDDILDSLEGNLTILAVVESLLEGISVNYEMFEKLYGQPYETILESLHIASLVKYCPEDGIVIFNPCLDLSELRQKFHEFKRVKASKLLKQLEIGIGHSKYSKKMGVLTHVVALGPGEHGVLIVAPWLVPSRRVERHLSNVARLIITSIPFRREFADYYHEVLESTTAFRKTGFVFMQEGVIYMVLPEKRDRILDTLVDFIYRTGQEVLEF